MSLSLAAERALAEVVRVRERHVQELREWLGRQKRCPTCRQPPQGASSLVRALR